MKNKKKSRFDAGLEESKDKDKDKEKEKKKNELDMFAEADNFGEQYDVRLKKNCFVYSCFISIIAVNKPYLLDLSIGFTLCT